MSVLWNVMLALIFFGGLISVIGMATLVNKMNSPWVGLEEPILRTKETKDRRSQEFWSVFNDPQNRNLVLLVFGGAALSTATVVLVSVLILSGTWSAMVASQG